MGVQSKAFGGNLKARWDFSKLSFEAKTLSALYGSPFGVSMSQVGSCILRPDIGFVYFGVDFFLRTAEQCSALAVYIII